MVYFKKAEFWHRTGWVDDDDSWVWIISAAWEDVRGFLA